MTYRSPIDIIRSHRKKAPVPVADIAKDLGIGLYCANGWSKEISGLIRKDPERGGPSGYAIITNAAHPVTRRRFTIAHEIGHFVLHTESLGAGVTDDGLYRSRLGGRLEGQANRFAGWLLMPRRLILEEVDRGVDSVEALARLFDVSKSAMAVRLGFPYERA